MEKQKQEKKKFQKWPIVVLVLLIVLVIGTTFAWFTLTKTSDKVNTIKAGSLSMVLDDKISDGILLQKAIPMSYQQGMNTKNYEFTLTNNGSKGDYKISLIDETTYTDSEGAQVTISDTDRIADTKIRYILLKDGEVAEASKSMLLSEAANRVIDSGTIASGTTITYSLRIWIDSKASNEVMGQIFNARLQLDATQHQEKIAGVTSICKRATTLHTETCNQTQDSYYCKGDGYGIGQTITYGNLGTTGTLTTGDAFDCDVNGDGTYDPTTERFYYVSDMTNEITTDANTAALIYYNNVSGGVPNNSTAYAYDESGINTNGPVSAVSQLPTTAQWKNVSLTSTTRDIYVSDVEPNMISFSYDGYAARFLSIKEVENGCYDGNTGLMKERSLSAKCKFLLENTNYSNPSSKIFGSWLEQPSLGSDKALNTLAETSRIFGYGVNNSRLLIGVRPVIEVPKTNIAY